MQRTLRTMVLISAAMTACVPDVYLIDRQTVLELEASGEWQELDRALLEKARSAGPLPIEATQEAIGDRQLFQMTHSDGESKAKSK